MEPAADASTTIALTSAATETVTEADVTAEMATEATPGPDTQLRAPPMAQEPALPGLTAILRPAGWDW